VLPVELVAVHAENATFVAARQHVVHVSAAEDVAVLSPCPAEELHYRRRIGALVGTSIRGAGHRVYSRRRLVAADRDVVDDARGWPGRPCAAR
jgi:hypothetical protein